MSWYGEDWSKRIPVTFVQPSSSPQTTIDLSAAIQTDLDYWWDYVDSSAADVRLTEADGVTLVSAATSKCTGWDLGTFSTANKTGTLRVDGWTGAVATNYAAHQLHLYYDADGKSTAVDGSVSLSSARTGYLRNDSARSYDKRVIVGAETPGATRPRYDFQKAVAEKLFVVWDFSRALIRRKRPYEGKVLFEELKIAEVDAGAGASSDTSLYDATETKFLPGHAVRCLYQAGTTATNYWIQCKVTTTEGRVLVGRASMRVRNPTEVA